MKMEMDFINGDEDKDKDIKFDSNWNHYSLVPSMLFDISSFFCSSKDVIYFVMRFFIYFLLFQEKENLQVIFS